MAESDAEARILEMIMDMASMSMALVSGFHCCKRVAILNGQTTGRLGNRCSMVNLL